MLNDLERAPAFARSERWRRLEAQQAEILAKLAGLFELESRMRAEARAIRARLDGIEARVEGMRLWAHSPEDVQHTEGAERSPASGIPNDTNCPAQP